MDGLVNVFPSWEIEKKIGNGRYGAVYRASRKDGDEEIRAAVKVIWFPLDFSQIKQYLSDGMSKEEVRVHLRKKAEKLVSELKNFNGLPNIVGVEDCKLVESEKDIGWDIYILMDMLTPLNKAFRSKKMDETDVAKLGVDICSALEVCSENNIVHGNIKPENIFVDKMGSFCLGDSALDQKIKDICESKPPVGVLNYAAPEVAKEKESDAISDIYSLGMVMYRLMNKNNLPFLSENSMVNANEREDAIGRRINGEPLPTPSEATEKMSEIILKACAFEPSDRFQSAAEMKKALLEAYKDVLTVTAVETATPKIAEKSEPSCDENEQKATATNRHLKPAASAEENSKNGVGATRSSLKPGPASSEGAHAADVRESKNTNATKSNDVKQTVNKAETVVKPSTDTKNYSDSKPSENVQDENSPVRKFIAYGTPQAEDEIAQKEDRRKMIASVVAVVILVAVSLIAMFVFLASSDDGKRGDEGSKPQQSSTENDLSGDVSFDESSTDDFGTNNSSIWDDPPANDSSSNDTSTEDTSTEDTSNDDTSNDDMSNDDTSNDDTSNDDTSGDDTSNDDTSNDDTSSDDTSNDDTSNDDTSNDDTSNDDTSSDDTSNDDTSNDDTSNDDTSNDDTSSDDTSNDDTSNDDTSNDDTSNDDSSSDDTSNDDTSGEDTSSDDTSGDDASSDDTSGDDTSSDDTSGDDTSGDDTSGDDTSSEDTSGGNSSDTPSDDGSLPSDIVET